MDGVEANLYLEVLSFLIRSKHEGFIEVHHIVPLHSIEGEVTVNHVTDLIPVCSNCHRKIHRKKDNILTPS